MLPLQQAYRVFEAVGNEKCRSGKGQGSKERFLSSPCGLIVSSRVWPSTLPHSLQSPPLRYGLAVTTPCASLKAWPLRGEEREGGFSIMVITKKCIWLSDAFRHSGNRSDGLPNFLASTSTDRRREAKLTSMWNQDDRQEWDRAWSKQTRRFLNTPLKRELINAPNWGAVVSATISQDPPEFSNLVPERSDECPVCGQITAGIERRAAHVHPEFENGVCNISFGVWVHAECLERCPDTGKPAPIPW